MKNIQRIKSISLEEAKSYISQDEDVQNSPIHYFTMTPLDTPPGVDGSWDVTYYTRRLKKTIPTDGEGDDIIYILSNPTFPGLLKIGYTRKEIGIRVKDLSKASGVPTPFKLEYVFKCYSGLQLESDVHKYLKDFRPNNNREFFDITINRAMDAIKYLGENYI
jgi:hypothetical protein